MSDEGHPFKPEHIYKKLIWRNTLGLSETMEQATTWSITGIAAIVGLLISNLDSVAQLVSRNSLGWGRLLFTASLVSGALSKQFGMAVTKGVQTIQSLEKLMMSESGRSLLQQVKTPVKQLIDEVADPFAWPLSAMMRTAGRNGLKDYLSADKRFIRLFCFQLGLVYLHGLFAAAGLIVIAVSIVK